MDLSLGSGSSCSRNDSREINCLLVLVKQFYGVHQDYTKNELRRYAAADCFFFKDFGQKSQMNVEMQRGCEGRYKVVHRSFFSFIVHLIPMETLKLIRKLAPRTCSRCFRDFLVFQFCFTVFVDQCCHTSRFFVQIRIFKVVWISVRVLLKLRILYIVIRTASSMK